MAHTTGARRFLPAGALALGLMMAVSAMAAAGAPEGVSTARETLWSLILKGGFIMIPLGLCSVIALAIAVERAISLQHDRVIPPNFIQGLREAMGSEPGANLQKACDYCDPHGALGRMLKAGIHNFHKGEEAVKEAIDEAGSREVDKLKRSLRWLAAIASVSPLLGLLGTVYGMISTFQTATAVGMGKGDLLAKGIYEALVTTAAGLTIGIPVLLVYVFLDSKIDVLVDEMDEMGIDFISTLMESGRKGA